jgi:hypothetical protein
VIAFIVSGETPDTDDSPQKILSFYVDNDAEQQWAAALLAWAAVFFLFFIGVLRTVLRVAEGAVGRLSTVAFGGGVVAAIGMLSFAGFTFALGDTADDGLTPQAAQALNALNSDFFFPVALGTAVLLISTGLATLRGAALPRWLGWAAVVVGVLAATPLGFFAFLAGLLWIAVTSIVLFTATPAAPSTGAGSAAQTPPPPA